MTLIKIPNNPFTDTVRKWKNPYWESRGITPNEALELDPRYKKLVRAYAQHNGVLPPYRFFEVRIINASPSVVYDKHMKWWNHPKLMDHVFWMFQKPRYDKSEGREPYGYYVLEPFESARVHQVGFESLITGLPTQQILQRAFTVPTECCELAWTETSAGYSDHIHHRPEIVKTQQDVDREASIKAAADEILKEGVDVNHAKAFTHINDEIVGKHARNS